MVALHLSVTVITVVVAGISELVVPLVNNISTTGSVTVEQVFSSQANVHKQVSKGLAPVVIKHKSIF